MQRSDELSGSELGQQVLRELICNQNKGNKKSDKKKPTARLAVVTSSPKKKAPRRKSSASGSLNLGELERAAKVISKAKGIIAQADGKKR